MCIFPIYLKKETWKQKISTSYHMVQVPCGRCLECLKLRVNSWYVRLQNEQKYSDTSFFVTLTIDDDHLEFSEDWRHNSVIKMYNFFLKNLEKKMLNKQIKKSNTSVWESMVVSLSVLIIILLFLIALTLILSKNVGNSATYILEKSNPQVSTTHLSTPLKELLK